jgi:hypothetical protein
MRVGISIATLALSVTLAAQYSAKPMDCILTLERRDSFPGLDQSELQELTVNWFAEFFRGNKDVITGKTKSRVAGDYIAHYEWTRGGTQSEFRNKLIVDIRDNEIKFSISHIEILDIWRIKPLGRMFYYNKVLPIERILYKRNGQPRSKRNYLRGDVDRDLESVYDSFVKYVRDPEW